MPLNAKAAPAQRAAIFSESFDLSQTRDDCSPIESGRDADALALRDPDECERLLQSYFLLLGERRLWWQRCAEAEDGKAWAKCVRAAIERVARRSHFDPELLADWLDESIAPLNGTRRRVLRIARELYFATRQADANVA